MCNRCTCTRAAMISALLVKTRRISSWIRMGVDNNEEETERGKEKEREEGSKTTVDMSHISGFLDVLASMNYHRG